MPRITSQLIEGLQGRYIILEEDGMYWAAEVVDINAIETSENCALICESLAHHDRPQMASQTPTSGAIQPAQPEVCDGR
jgi:hypothetical protein